jgi:O-antigen/teichoic acid export membrane protein
MLKQFFKDSAVYGLSTMLARGLSLILLPFYTRVLSPTDYGIIDILRIFTTLAGLTVALEISQGVARYYADAETGSDKISYASTSLWFTVGVYTLFAIMAYSAARPLSQWMLDSAAQAAVFRVAVLSIWVGGLLYLAQNQLRWQLQPRLYAIASLSLTGVTISASILFVLVLRQGVIGVVYGQLIGGIVAAALSFYFARDSYRLVFDWAKCKEMLQFSLPLVPSGIGVFVTLYIDRIAIKELMSVADVGLFGVGYRLASIVNLLMVGVQGALMPLVYTHHRQPDTPHEVARIFCYFVATALLIFLGLSLFAHEVLVVLTAPEYYAAVVVVPLLVPATLLSGMYIFAPGLAIAKKTGIIATVNLIGAVLNTGLNFTLIPILGIQGAALATFLSAGVVFAIYIYYSQKFYFIPYGWLPLSFAVLVTIGLFTIGTQIDLSWWVDIVIKTILICLAAALFIRLRLIDIVTIKQAWRWLKQRQQLIARV